MRIVLSGIETNNKGAELMLYAILQEIESRYAEAEVFVPLYAVKQGIEYVKTNVCLKDKPFAKIKRLCNSCHIQSVLRRLHLPYSFLLDSWPVKNVDFFIDASGFHFSDQWDIPIEHWRGQLLNYSKQGSKIIFLPQAFGPVKKKQTRDAISLLNQFADVVMPREQLSYDYLIEAAMDKTKLSLYKDFTSLVDGVFPSQYENLRQAVCIIPNIRMFDKGTLNLDKYLVFIKHIVDESRKQDKKVYLLNHEGSADEKLAYEISRNLNSEIPVVTKLNALEVKGLISQSYICVTSRFHGAASALNTCVPCLATSWSHKYKELFLDYGLTDSILNLDDIDSSVAKFDFLMCDTNNYQMRQRLSTPAGTIKDETHDMWELVWSR